MFTERLWCARKPWSGLRGYKYKWDDLSPNFSWACGRNKEQERELFSREVSMSQKSEGEGKRTLVIGRVKANMPWIWRMWSPAPTLVARKEFNLKKWQCGLAVWLELTQATKTQSDGVSKDCGEHMRGVEERNNSLLEQVLGQGVVREKVGRESSCQIGENPGCWCVTHLGAVVGIQHLDDTRSQRKGWLYFGKCSCLVSLLLNVHTLLNQT